MAQTSSAHRVSHFFAKGTDPDELSKALSTSRTSLTAHPAANNDIAFECEFASAGPITLGLCRYEGEMRIKRQSEADNIIILLPRYGRLVLEASAGEILSTPARGVIVEASQDGSLHFLEDRQHLAIAIDQKELRNQLTQILEAPVPGSLEFAREIDLTAGPGMSLMQLATTLYAGLTRDAPLRRAPLALSSLSNGLMQLLLETVPHRLSSEMARTGSSPIPRHVKRAIEFMRANLSAPVTMQQLAAACGVSARTLQQSFRQFKMTTPMAYLHHLRLEAAHRELIQANPGQTVADIALKWGFIHLGRFAADYRARFGELPSHTLRTRAPGGSQ
ncbi:AraC family transcriptional regulator [Ensifer aridi]|uniref:AraC family transcriptional regulator n=1 Tax=Ensifer aridi TaxID=1708715 RepID=UPI00358EFF52